MTTTGTRRQVGAIDSDLLDRVDSARGYEPRTKLVERLLEGWLENGGALGAVSSGPPESDAGASSGALAPQGATPSGEKRRGASSAAGRAHARAAGSPTASRRAPALTCPHGHHWYPTSMKARCPVCRAQPVQM